MDQSRMAEWELKLGLQEHNWKDDAKFWGTVAERIPRKIIVWLPWNLEKNTFKNRNKESWHYGSLHTHKTKTIQIMHTAENQRNKLHNFQQ